MDRPASQPTADLSTSTPTGDPALTGADKRTAFQRETWQQLVDKTSTLPVELEEGYYQVLNRMHPDWDPDHLLTEAHRIKHIANDRDILRVGERLPLATDEDRRALLKECMDAYDHGQGQTPDAGTAGDTTIKDFANSFSHPVEAPPVDTGSPSSPPEASSPSGIAQPGAEASNPTGAPKPTEEPKPTAAEPPKPAETQTTEQQQRMAVAAQLEEAHNAATKKLTDAETKQGIIGNFVDGTKNAAYALGISSDASGADPRGWLANLIIDGANGSTAMNTQMAQEQKRVEDLKQAANAGDTARFNAIYKELTGSNYNPNQQRGLLNAGNAGRYDDSQHGGVDAVTSFAAAGAAMALGRFGLGGAALTPKLVLGGAAIGAGTKSAFSAIDGTYANFGTDALTGAVWGGLMPVAEMAGARVSTNLAARRGLSLVGDGLATRISTEGATFGTRVLSAAAKSGTSMALFGAVEGPADDIIRNGSQVTAPELISRSVTGAVTGFAGGTVFGVALDRLAEGSNRPAATRPVETAKPVDECAPPVAPLPRENAGGGQLLGNKYSNQQDSFYVSNDKKLFVVADGVGGRDGGEIASNIVATAMKEKYASFPHNGTDLDVQRWLDNAVKSADRQVVLGQAVHEKMASTVVAAVHHNDKVFVAWAGDSRLYLIRDGVARQVTEDHLAFPDVPSRRNAISRFAGLGDLDVDHALVSPARPGDRFVLMSDGINLPGDDIARIVGGAPDAKTGVDHLLSYVDSLKRDVQDNATAVGFEVPAAS